MLIKYLTSLALPILVLSISCKEKTNKNQVYFRSGALKELIVYDKKQADSKIVISFYETGGIKSINRYDKSEIPNGEQLNFFDNGNLDGKVFMHNGKANGNAYYFFYENGALKSDRYFRDGNPVFYGADYWGDSLGTMKTSIHFNDSGSIIFKKNFDSNGKFISEEGERQ